MNICVYGSSSNIIDPQYLEKSYDLAKNMAKRGHALVFGGGTNGVMGATARGATQNGGIVIGIAPSFFTVDGVLYDKCTEFIYTETMRERKAILEQRSDAFIIAPGGIGTFDEFFEILTLKQLEKHNKPIAIYNVNGYYDELLVFLQKVTDERFMKDKSLQLFKSFSDEDELLDYIENYNEQQISIRELKQIG